MRGFRYGILHMNSRCGLPIKSHNEDIPAVNLVVITKDLLTCSLAQQPLKSFDRPLMRVSLSNSILVTLISTRGRVMGDKSIAS